MLRSATSEERLSKQMRCVHMTAETVPSVDAISRLQGQTHASNLLLHILLQPVAYERYVSLFILCYFFMSIETAD